jgi:hypothetical protein
MSRTKQWTVNKTYQPAAVGTAETPGILAVKKGQRVIAVTCMPLIAAGAGTNTTISLGDTAGVATLLAAVDTETMTPGTPIDSVAAALANAGGKLYTADDTIKADYINGGTPGAVNPKVRFTVTIRDERY